jgi:hypothetical protein
MLHPDDSSNQTGHLPEVRPGQIFSSNPRATAYSAKSCVLFKSPVNNVRASAAPPFS